MPTHSANFGAADPAGPAGHGRIPAARPQSGGAGGQTLDSGVSPVFADPGSRSQLDLLKRTAPSDIPVLLRGDWGTGKESIARYLHVLSGREGPLVVVRCGAPTGGLRPGELSVASIRHDNAGECCESWFTAAAGGTLLLDEVSELTSSVQAELVRVLQNHQRSQSKEGQPSDARLISTTTVILTDEVAAGRFRPDLLYRLNIATLTLLPLIRRKGDIVPLAEHFIREYSRRVNRLPPTLSADAALALTQHLWPGNIRELENVIRLAVLLTPAQRLTSEHLRLDSVGFPVTFGAGSRLCSEAPTQTLGDLLAQMFEAPGPRLLERIEAEVVAKAFDFSGRNQVRAAALLGISRNVLRTLLKKHQLYEIRPYSSEG